jgi:hypothetical protein
VWTLMSILPVRFIGHPRVTVVAGSIRRKLIWPVLEKGEVAPPKRDSFRGSDKWSSAVYAAAASGREPK